MNILILLGAIQGTITTILLVNFKSKKNANSVLAWLMLLISLACFNLYFLETVEFSKPFWMVLAAILPLVIIMPFGPLVYFYVKAICYPEFKLGKKNSPHFYTIVLDFVPYMVSAIYIIGSYSGFIGTEDNLPWEHFIDRYNVYVDIPRWVSLGIYLVLTYKIIRTYQANEHQKDILRWSKQFTMGFSVFLIIWLLFLVPYTIPSLSNKLLGSVGWYPIYIPLIILVYWLGINGFIISFKTYGKSSKKLDLFPKVIEDTKLALEKAMKIDKLYLNPSLKLDDVVKHTQIPQKTISRVLNQYMKKTFNEYINGFRVEAVKSKLLEDGAKNLTITGIAFECGFNSQATFQRTFRAFTNVSPKEFQKKYTNQFSE